MQYGFIVTNNEPVALVKNTYDYGRSICIMTNIGCKLYGELQAFQSRVGSIPTSISGMTGTRGIGYNSECVGRLIAKPHN